MITGLVGVNINAQSPIFRSTLATAADFTDRLPVLVQAIRNAGAKVAIFQELNGPEAARVLARLGSKWGYDRAGLNTVAWRRDLFSYHGTAAKDLASFGQMQRTAVAVKLRAEDGSRLRLSSTHLANRSATDLTIDPLHAQARQQAQFCGWVNNDADDWPTVHGEDANSRKGDDGSRAPRSILRRYGWKIDSDVLEVGAAEADARHGIDLVATNYGAVLDRVDVIPLGRGSDHDGRRFVLHTTRA